MSRRLVFAHGLEGSPSGRKATALRAAGFPVTAPDFGRLGLAERVEILERETRMGRVVLVGSSYGGLVAALVAQRHPQRFDGLLLCAPALALPESPNDEPQQLRAPAGLTTLILHGRRDTIVPIAWSREYQQRSGDHVTLHEVDDDHRLAASMALLLTLVGQLWAAAGD